MCPLSLHDALPIYALPNLSAPEAPMGPHGQRRYAALRAALVIPSGALRVGGRHPRDIHIPVAGTTKAGIVGLNPILRLQTDVQIANKANRQIEVAEIGREARRERGRRAGRRDETTSTEW